MLDPEIATLSARLAALKRVKGRPDDRWPRRAIADRLLADPMGADLTVEVGDR
jgi:hypothetical protein